MKYRIRKNKLGEYLVESRRWFLCFPYWEIDAWMTTINKMTGEKVYSDPYFFKTLEEAEYWVQKHTFEDV